MGYPGMSDVDLVQSENGRIIFEGHFDLHGSVGNIMAQQQTDGRRCAPSLPQRTCAQGKVYEIGVLSFFQMPFASVCGSIR
jgi:hypothetical protein